MITKGEEGPLYRQCGSPLLENHGPKTANVHWFVTGKVGLLEVQETHRLKTTGALGFTNLTIKGYKTSGMMALGFIIYN